LESTLDESEAIERKLRGASQELSAVRQALESEVRERIMVDHQLAAAVEQEEGSRQAAFHDVLTGLPNRSLFNNRLEHAFAQAERHGQGLAVMFVDLDDFKVINDSHGHDAGDRVLQAIAERLEENVRGEDTVSRQGGDEFLCLLTDVRDTAHIVAIADKLIRAMQAPCHLRIGDLDINPTINASIGISIFPKNGSTVDALVKSADEAMYRAKRTRSQYSFAL
jgi:diguanylate cyclase (GGDEF)-like protein